MNDDSAPRSPSLAAIETLDDAACRALLGRQRLCIMSVVDGTEPYGVPLYYGFDGTTIYLGVAEGRKTQVLDANPAICLTVTEIAAGEAWSSVQVTGRAEWLEGADRERGVAVLMEHNRRVRGLQAGVPGPGAADPGAPAPRRHGGGRLLRIAGPRLSGRTRP